MSDSACTVEDAERGSILVLTVGFVAIALLLVAVVVDVSALFLSRRSLAATADGAAARAAQAISTPDLYQAHDQDVLPVTTDAAAQAVHDYLNQAADDQRGVRVVEVTTDGSTVTVLLAEQARLPFWSAVSADPTGVEVSAEAVAHTAVAR